MERQRIFEVLKLTDEAGFFVQKVTVDALGNQLIVDSFMKLVTITIPIWN